MQKEISRRVNTGCFVTPFDQFCTPSTARCGSQSRSLCVRSRAIAACSRWVRSTGSVRSQWEAPVPVTACSSHGAGVRAEELWQPGALGAEEQEHRQSKAAEAGRSPSASAGLIPPLSSVPSACRAAWTELLRPRALGYDSVFLGQSAVKSHVTGFEMSCQPAGPESELPAPRSCSSRLFPPVL